MNISKKSFIGLLIFGLFLIIFIFCFPFNKSFSIESTNKDLATTQTQTYKISYVLNGGKNNINNPTYYKTNKAITLKNPTKNGYTFQGWYSDSKFKNKVTSIPKNSKGNKIFYAKWIINPILTGLSGRANIDKHIETFKTRYKNSLKGGIALVGSSSFARWNCGNEFKKLGWNLQKLYNCSISGARISDLANNDKYIQLISSFQPSVILIYGSNDLGLYSTDSSKNISLTSKLIKDINSFITKVSIKCKKKPVFIVIGPTKTPKDYINANKNKFPKSCIAWDRIDIYSNKLKQYAKTKSNIIYYDVAKNFEYKNDNGQMIFYLDQNKKQTANMKQIINKTKTIKLFESDLAHPSKLAYETIWNKVANFAILNTKK